MNEILKQIETERQKQIGKGYTAGHDDTHDRGEILHYARGHMEAANMKRISNRNASDKKLYELVNMMHVPSGWKVMPNDVRGHLIVAAALIVAEIERMDRVK